MLRFLTSLMMSLSKYLTKLSQSALVIPTLNKNNIKGLNKMLFNFQWVNKQDKINRSDVLRPAGLGMFEVESFWKALQFSRIRRLVNTDYMW